MTRHLESPAGDVVGKGQECAVAPERQIAVGLEGRDAEGPRDRTGRGPDRLHRQRLLNRNRRHSPQRLRIRGPCKSDQFAALPSAG